MYVGEDGYVHRADDVNSLAHNHYDIYRDYRDRMWIGTFGGGLDLAVYQKNDFVFRHFLKGSFGEQEVRTITADRNHWMWVGTNNGIYVFHPDSLLNDSRQYYVYNLIMGKIRSNEIRNIFCDSKGHMWIGTTGKGFSVCQSRQTYDQLEFRHYDEDDGLVNNVVSHSGG